MSANLLYYLEVLIRLILASVLGGIVGAERESENKNAGFRTHILVCIASALTMITSEFIFKQYHGLTNLDPARLGAQVISGIGFLGAGAIIRDGFSVKGLTTAASLWAVACVGLACGIGFYEGAVFATIIIMLVLFTLKKLGSRLRPNTDYAMIISAISIENKVHKISEILASHNIGIEKMMITEDKYFIIRIMLKTIKRYSAKDVDSSIEEIQMIGDIHSVQCIGNFSDAESYKETIDEMEI